jgi:hypothetical protein
MAEHHRRKFIEAARELSKSQNSWPALDASWCNRPGRIEALQKRTLRTFPPSFQYFLTNYSFPAFDCGAMTFFANTGADVYWKLEKKLFLDPNMSPDLLRAGFLQIGNPFIGNYDPICFDCNRRTVEHRIVQLDHEEILCNSRITL